MHEADGLSVRQLADRTGRPKSATHRDLKIARTERDHEAEIQQAAERLMQAAPEPEWTPDKPAARVFVADPESGAYTTPQGRPWTSQSAGLDEVVPRSPHEHAAPGDVVAYERLLERRQVARNLRKGLTAAGTLRLRPLPDSPDFDPRTPDWSYAAEEGEIETLLERGWVKA